MQESTRVTPFELVFGRPVTTTLDAMLAVDNGVLTGTEIDDFTARAEEAHQLARFRIRKRQEMDARQSNQGRRNVECLPGELVWVWTPIRRHGLSEKLLRRYFGPYKVVGRISDLNYEVLPESNSTACSHVLWRRLDDV